MSCLGQVIQRSGEDWNEVKLTCIPHAVRVPADGSPHKATVARVNLQPESDYLSAPRLVPAVYWRAKIRNDSLFTFLPGVVNLFDHEEFLGATRLDLIAPQGEMELFLGVEDRVRADFRIDGARAGLPAAFWNASLASQIQGDPGSDSSGWYNFSL